MPQSLNHKKGFTLIEIMVAVSIFSFIMVISLGAIISVLNANRKSQSLRTVMDNVNATMEDMTRTIRFGTNYHCGSSGDTDTPLDCGGGGTSLTVLASTNHTYAYALSQGRITRVIDHAGTAYNITSPDVTITKLSFRVYGSAPYLHSTTHCSTGSPPGLNDCLQPFVIMLVSGYAGASPSIQTSFTLETSVSQRQFDVK